ncbi:LysR family transcriptional regulator [Marinobacterium arenosum]|uniref:LysR family transcriptional regulator n=1 Tax=Marinobacterium arenosum TaxID=2862496 RepID=UPI001C958E5B|nr:LysR family transcriptional regulator [Marinobacterium arenosum]MBY4677110.1 LysR family transcriptional regulator [Marinobacterium arenosum]
MNLNDLRLFIRVVETSSFTAAADSLGLQKSTISRRIAQLEDSLGVRLLQRSTRKLQLTDEGMELYNRCRPLIDELEQTQEQVAATNAEPRGRLKLTMPPELGVFIMNGVVGSFLKRFPKVEVDVELSTRLVDLIEDGIDLAIRVGKLTDSTLVARKLAELDMGLYASPAYLASHGVPKTPDDLAEHNCMTVHRTANTWQFETWRDGEPVPVQGRLHANSINFLREILLQDMGIARMPRQYCAEMVEQGLLQPVLEAYHLPPIEIHALYPSRRHLNPRVRLFIDHMLESLAGHPWIKASNP